MSCIMTSQSFGQGFALSENNLLGVQVWQSNVTSVMLNEFQTEMMRFKKCGKIRFLQLFGVYPEKLLQ